VTIVVITEAIYAASGRNGRERRREMASEWWVRDKNVVKRRDEAVHTEAKRNQLTDGGVGEWAIILYGQLYYDVAEHI